MSYVEELVERAKGSVVAFHKFMLSQSEKRLVHVFVESAVDMLFYKPHIERRAFKTATYDCVNRDGVLDVMTLIMNQTKRLNECLFMIDADYKRFTFGEKFLQHPWTSRLFVTKGYSVENYFDINAIIDYIIVERNGRDNSSSQASALSDNIKAAFCHVKSKGALISAVMIGIRDQQLTANFNDFAFQQCFRMTPCFVWSQKRIIRHFLKSAGVDPRSINWKGVISKLRMFRHEEPYKWFRGKYYLLAIIKILSSTLNSRNIKTIPCVFCSKRPKPFLDCTTDQFIEVYGPRIETPADIEAFLCTRLGG